MYIMCIKILYNNIALLCYHDRRIWFYSANDLAFPGKNNFESGIIKKIMWKDGKESLNVKHPHLPTGISAKTIYGWCINKNPLWFLLHLMYPAPQFETYSFKIC